MIFMLFYKVLLFGNVPRDLFNPDSSLSPEIKVIATICKIGIFILNPFMIFMNLNFNMKHMNFKRYLKELYKGLEIRHRYEHASIFIKRSR